MATLTPQEELRALHREWFRASSAKDIEGAMEPIAEDALSYEHEAPLSYSGKEAIRAVCQHGFDLAEGEFTWDVPDLEVLVSGDLAVAFGLNRMRVRGRNASLSESWSRGTRVFRRIDGIWKMVHQHVSFPTIRPQEWCAPTFDLRRPFDLDQIPPAPSVVLRSTMEFNLGKKRRYDIVREGATWTVGVGGPSLRGYLSQAAAIAAAREAARHARALGQEIEIFLWNGAEPILIEDTSGLPQK